MLHTKSDGNRSTGSRGEDILTVFTIYGHDDHFGHVTGIMSINFHFLVPKSLQTKFSSKRPCGF